MTGATDNIPFTNTTKEYMYHRKMVNLLCNSSTVLFLGGIKLFKRKRINTIVEKRIQNSLDKLSICIL